MSQLVRSIVTVAAVSLWICLASQVAEACKCNPPLAQPLEEQVAAARDGASYVFVARVLSTRELGGRPPRAAATLKVLERFKGLGENLDSITVTTLPDALCGYTFKPEEEYLVYAYGTKESGNSNAAKLQIVASVCSRTAPLSRASKDLTYLRKSDR